MNRPTCVLLSEYIWFKLFVCLSFNLKLPRTEGGYVVLPASGVYLNVEEAGDALLSKRLQCCTIYTVVVPNSFLIKKEHMLSLIVLHSGLSEQV